MTTTDRTEEIIKEIAAKHGIAVGRNDPILVLQTLNERLIKDSLQSQEKALASFKEEMEAISQRWSEDAKGKAERTLNAAIIAGKEAMLKGMQEATQKMVESVKMEIEATIGRQLKESRRMAHLNMLAAGLAIVAAALAVWAAK